MACTDFISSRAQRAFKKLFYSIGVALYYHPWRFILCGLLLTCLSSIGFLRLTVETDTWLLWIPLYSEIYHEYNTYTKYFGEFPKSMVILFKENNNENLLTPSKMDAMYNIFKVSMNSSIISIKSPIENNDNNNNMSNTNRWGFNDLCQRPYDSYPLCESVESNIFSFFNNTPTQWSTQESIDFVVNTYSNSIEYFIGGLQYSNYSSIDIFTNNSNISTNTDDDSMNVETKVLSGATYLQIYYTLEGTDKQTFIDAEEKLCHAFEKYWNKVTSTKYNSNSNSKKNNDTRVKYEEYKELIENNVSLTFYTSYSWQSETDRVAQVDAPLFGYAFTAMLIVLCLMLTKNINCVEIKMVLALASLFITFCALAIGCGIGCALGYEFSTIILLVPFILLGVGIDDDLSLVFYRHRANII